MRLFVPLEHGALIVQDALRWALERGANGCAGAPHATATRTPSDRAGTSPDSGADLESLGVSRLELARAGDLADLARMSAELQSIAAADLGSQISYRVARESLDQAQAQGDAAVSLIESARQLQQEISDSGRIDVYG